MSTVHDIQNLLDFRTKSNLRYTNRAFLGESADYTDNEMSDEIDDDDDDNYYHLRSPPLNGIDETKDEDEDDDDDNSNNNEPQIHDFFGLDNVTSSVKPKEYKFKSIDIENDIITCTCCDNSNGIIKDIKINIKELESHELMEMRQIIEKGQTEKTDVVIVVFETKGTRMRMILFEEWMGQSWRNLCGFKCVQNGINFVNISISERNEN